MNNRLISGKFAAQLGRRKRESAEYIVEYIVQHVSMGFVVRTFTSYKGSTIFSNYSQTCIKRTPLGLRKGGILRQVTSQKRINSYKIFYDDKKRVTF